MEYNKYMLKNNKSDVSGFSVMSWIIIGVGCFGFLIVWSILKDAETALHEIEAFLIGICSILCICTGMIVLILCKIHHVIYYKKSYEDYVKYYHLVYDDDNGFNNQQMYSNSYNSNTYNNGNNHY